MTSNNGILELLKNASQMLPKKQRQVCKYILNHPREACSCTLQELAETNGVGTSTVVRLMSSLGISGYSDFKHALHAAVYQDELKTSRMIRDMNLQIATYSGKTDIDSMRILLQVWQQRFQDFDETAFLKQLSDAAYRIMGAKRLYVFGQTAFRGVSEYFEWMLRRFVGPIVQLGNTDFYMEELQRMTQEDLLVLFVPIITKKSANIAAYACKARIPTLLFSSSSAEDIRFKNAGQVIRIGNGGGIQEIFSYIAAIGLLKVPIVRCRGEEALSRLDQIQAQLHELNIFDDSTMPFEDYPQKQMIE